VFRVRFETGDHTVALEIAAPDLSDTVPLMYPVFLRPRGQRMKSITSIATVTAGAVRYTKIPKKRRITLSLHDKPPEILKLVVSTGGRSIAVPPP